MVHVLIKEMKELEQQTPLDLNYCGTIKSWIIK